MGNVVQNETLGGMLRRLPGYKPWQFYRLVIEEIGDDAHEASGTR